MLPRKGETVLHAMGLWLNQQGCQTYRRKKLLEHSPVGTTFYCQICEMLQLWSSWEWCCLEWTAQCVEHSPVIALWRDSLRRYTPYSNLTLQFLLKTKPPLSESVVAPGNVLKTAIWLPLAHFTDSIKLWKSQHIVLVCCKKNIICNVYIL